MRRTARWYVSRARAMSGREIAWRAAQGARRRISTRQVDARRLDWDTGTWPAFVRALGADVAADADRVAAGELCYWGRTAHLDPRALPWEQGPFGPSSDPKLRWELRRQQHLVALAAGGYERLCIEQMLDWLARRPLPDEGASAGYEAAHRVTTWSWALPFAAGAATRPERERIEESFRADVALIRARPSRYSSANNHRLAELAGLLAYEAVTVDRAGWNATWSEFEREVVRQTFADGGSREQATGYFLYVLEIIWVAALCAHAVGQRIDRVADRAAAALAWLDAAAGSDGEPPQFGDDAEDRFIRVDYYRRRQATLLSRRLRTVLDGEPTLYPTAPPPAVRSSCVLRDSGYVVMRGRVASDPVRLVVDVGPLGFGELAAHGHADALSITLDVGEETVLRDSGTGTYVVDDGRDAFRITPAHNTVSVGGDSQAEPLGPHLWGRRFTTTIQAISLDAAVDYVRASHDGYRPRAEHTRAVAYLKPDLVVVLDRVVARTPHTVELNWQTMPSRSFTGIVAAWPAPATRLETEVVFSPRYTWLEAAPRTTFSVQGCNVVFATVLPLASPAAVEFEHHENATVVHVQGRARLVERWSGGPALVEAP